ncbi:MAG: aminomethyl-transferring glycine dehydrogenase subunit GcvPA [Anaerolineales bacterium]|nr:aminomethyl-transferring glycine dehydrogenase subunit GcvPA [Anaerolineales bacterium]
MPFLPHTEAERAEMLKAVGVNRIEDLFSAVPETRRYPKLNLPAPASEPEAISEMRFLAEANVQAQDTACFLGAGAYHHYIPPAVNHLLLRGEFYTAYTPYQPEISQGTLQSIFEFQTLIAALTGMEAANASHYDGATAAAEAVVLALQQSRGRRRVVLSPVLHPHYRRVIRTYLQGADIHFAGDETPETYSAFQARSRIKHLATCVDESTAVVVAPYPSFVGEVDDLAPLAEVVHTAGALLAVAVNPIALGLLKPPGEMGADIVFGEGQPLGIPLSCGGPYLGFFATRRAYLHKMSGRIAGETSDGQGRRGYVLTLAAREQHIKRERASSNICTNQALMALAATVYLSLLGKHGLRRVAELCYHRANYAADRVARLPGFQVVSRFPFFHEFVLRCPKSVAEINRNLLDHWEIIGGYDLGRDFPCLANHMLLAFTEMTPREQIDRLADALAEESL